MILRFTLSALVFFCIPNLSIFPQDKKPTIEEIYLNDNAFSMEFMGYALSSDKEDKMQGMRLLHKKLFNDQLTPEQANRCLPVLKYLSEEGTKRKVIQGNRLVNYFPLVRIYAFCLMNIYYNHSTYSEVRKEGVEDDQVVLEILKELQDPQNFGFYEQYYLELYSESKYSENIIPSRLGDLYMVNLRTISYLLDNEEGILIIYLQGLIDINRYNVFEMWMQKYIDAGFSYLIIDCSSLESVIKRAEVSFIKISNVLDNNGGEMILTNVKPGLLGLIPHKENVDDAIEYFKNNRKK